MKEPSLGRMLLRSAARGFFGQAPADREFCENRDRLWLQYKLSHSRIFLSGIGKFSEARIGPHLLQFRSFPDLMRVYEEIFGRRIYAFQSPKKDPLILDLGANIGMAVSFFKQQYPQARILAFEPDPANFEILSRNVKKNAWSGVELHPSLLAGREGEFDFYTAGDAKASLESSIFQGRLPQAAKVKVKAALLSGFIREEVDFLKMDIEGSEGIVLQELSESGALNKIKAMAIEYHHRFPGQEQSLAAFLKLLEDAGFYTLLSAPFEGADPPDRFQDILIHARRHRQ